MAEPTFKRDPVAEAAAIAAGIATKEQIESRGGVNASGYYGDSYREGITLTDEEYAKAIRDAKESGATGGKIGAAVNVASGTKAYNYYISQGMNPGQAELLSGFTAKGEPSKLGGGQSTAASFYLDKLKSGEITKEVFDQIMKEINSGTTPSKVSTSPTGSVVSGFNPATGLYTASDGKTFSNSDSYVAYQSSLDSSKAERKSAYDLLYQQFAKYGLQGLVTPLEGLIKEGIPASEFAIRLRDTDAYQRRFSANKARINKGLAALSEAEYIGLEDQYQNIMRQYGMPESYYARGDMGIQQGFEKLIAGDVSAVELENRISNAYNRVINANPEVVQALKQYYPNITNGDILSYALDPEKALTDINKKITAAEIGGAAMGAGLGIDVTRAEQLGAAGITKAQAQQGYQTIAEILPTEMKLSEIYRRQGLGPYNQAVAEAEVFGLSGAAEAAKQRKKYTELEQAQFSGQSGVGALARERAGSF